MNNLVKDLLKEKEEKVYKKRKDVRAFAIQVSSYRDFLDIPYLVSKINPGGFLNYYTESPAVSRSELELRAIKEFIKDEEDGVCYILCNEDVPCAYPEKPSVVRSRYHGIGVYRREGRNKLVKINKG